MATSHPPTEAEIRAAIRAAADGAGDIDIGTWVYAILRPLTPPGDRRGATLWDDLRPSEAARLEELRETVYTAMEAVEDSVVERIAEAAVRIALQFAAEHPGAPRP